MADRKILGRATIHVNGQFFDSQPGAALMPGGLRNTSRPFTHTIKYNQVLMPGRVTCAIPVTEDVSVKELQEMAEVEITFQGDTGRTYIVRNAVQTAEVSVADGDSGGMAALEFSGDPAEEVIG